jgi:hypothetical protein
MKNENTYKILILYIIFLVIRKIVDFTVEIHIPTYENLKKESKFWKDMVLLRRVLCFMDIMFIIFIFAFYKLNTFINIILFLIFLGDLEYILIDERIIDYITGKSSQNNKVINFVDHYGDRIRSLFAFLFCFYVIINIF